jgi:hypothetical protein
MTIEELLEIEEIKLLRVMYSHHFDGGQLDQLANLFTEDAVCEFTEEYGGNWVGRDTIKANYARYATPDRPFSFMHANTNPWIRLLSPTEANGRWYLLDLTLREGVESPLGLFGVYDDVYRKVDGKWLIARTRIDFLWPNRSFFGFRSPGVNG